MASKKASQPMTLETWLAEGHKRRLRMFEAEVEFFLWLVEGEARFRHLWAMYGSFARLLEQEAFAKVSRYEEFRDGLSIINRADALKIGVDGVIQTAKVKNETRRAKALQNQLNWVSERGHTPSSETTRNLVRAADPKEITPRTTASAQLKDRLLEENQQLRARVRELETENKRLLALLEKKKKAA